MSFPHPAPALAFTVGLCFLQILSGGFFVILKNIIYSTFGLKNIPCIISLSCFFFASFIKCSVLKLLLSMPHFFIGYIYFFPLLLFPFSAFFAFQQLVCHLDAIMFYEYNLKIYVIPKEDS